MSSDKSPQNLFNEALERADPVERARFLDEACGADTALRERVEKLLRAHDEAGGFFSQPSKAPSSQASRASALPVTEKPGDRIGRYKLLQQIGEGGCGVVYMAEQEEPMRRRVALKVIKLGMDTKQVIARFEAERQALALMDHPNIARVLDAGATGAPVAAGILPAVEPGFQPGGRGEGDSKRTENSVAGPGGKMPPSTAGETPAATLSAGRPYFVMELVRGVKITEFCDQKQLSTEERLELFIAVCQAVQHAHQKGIIHRDLKPSNILVTTVDGASVPKVIDFGIAKATNNQPLTDRTLFTAFEQFIGTPAYMSPEQAEMSGVDIDTRTDIYSLGVLLYELLTGCTPFEQKELLAAGLDGMRRIIREQEPPRPSTRLSTLAVEQLTTTARHRHTDSPKLVHLVRGDLDWIVMKCLDKERDRRYESANGLAQDVNRYLKSEPIVARPPSRWYEFQKTVRRHKFGFAAATALIFVLAIGVVISTWQTVRATKAENLATDRLAQVAAERDAKEQARQEAEAISSFMVEVIQSPDPTRDGRTIQVVELLDDAAKKLDTELASQPARRARLRDRLGLTYAALGLYREAIPLQEKARDYYLATLGREHLTTLDVIDSLATCYFEAGRRGEALKMREEALVLRREVNGPEHPDTLRNMSRLATSYSDADRRDEALKMREEALTLLRKVNGPEHAATLNAMHNLANSYAEMGRPDKALVLREQVLALRPKVSGPEHPDTLKAMITLSVSYADAGRRDDALKLREEVLTLCRKVHGPEHPDTIRAIHHLANSYADAGRGHDALELREAVLALRRKVAGPEHPDTLWAMISLARTCRAIGRRDEAIQLGQTTVEISRRVSGPTHSQTLSAMTELASSYQIAGRTEEAIALEEETLWLKRQHLPPGDSHTIESLQNLAKYYDKANRKPEAEVLRREAEELKSMAKAR